MMYANAPRRNDNSGFTLVELMMALFISIIVLAATFGLMNRSQQTFTRENQVTQTNQSLRVGLDMISRDLRDAGYETPAAAAVLLHEGGNQPDGLTTISADDVIPRARPFRCSDSSVGNPCQSLDELSSINLNTKTFDPPQVHPEQAYSNGMYLLAIESGDCNEDGHVGIFPLELTRTPVLDTLGDSLQLFYQAGFIEGLNLPSGYNTKVLPDCAVVGRFRVIQYRIHTVASSPTLERRDLSTASPWTPVSANIENLQVQFADNGGPSSGFMSTTSQATANGVKVTLQGMSAENVLGGASSPSSSGSGGSGFTASNPLGGFEPSQSSSSGRANGSLSAASSSRSPHVPPSVNTQSVSTSVTIRNTTEVAPSADDTEQVAAEGLDQYGGIRAVSSPNGGTGFFRVEKFGNRWMLVTPEGHPYWFKGVALVADNTPGRDDTGRSYDDYIEAKYESKAVWAAAIKRRLLAWGFNGLGYYSVPRVQSYNNFGREPVDPLMPHFDGTFKFAHSAMENAGDRIDQPVKNLFWMIPDGGVFPDVFDPRFETYAFAGVKVTATTGGISTEVNSPWVIAWIPDESDNFTGFSERHVHLGWGVLASAPSQSVGNYRSREFQYPDAKVYSKFALRDFLKQRYSGSLFALNAAWGSSYTSWDSDGGYGTGTGLLDEDGRTHSWVGDRRTLEGSTEAFKRDLDEFTFLLAERFFKTVHDAIRSVDRNHLIASPVTLGGGTREPVLRAAKNYVDLVFAASRARPRSESDDGSGWGPDAWEIVSSVTGKPLIGAAYFITAEPDSPISQVRYISLPTQEARGQEYAAHLERLRSFKAADGTQPFVGFHWWALVDNWNEKRNYGLVTIRDNAYDGQEAVRAPGKDPWGYPTGGEVEDYGDFMTFARDANFAIVEKLRQELWQRLQ